MRRLLGLLSYAVSFLVAAIGILVIIFGFAYDPEARGIFLVIFAVVGIVILIALWASPRIIRRQVHALRYFFNLTPLELSAKEQAMSKRKFKKFLLRGIGSLQVQLDDQDEFGKEAGDFDSAKLQSQIDLLGQRLFIMQGKTPPPPGRLS